MRAVREFRGRPLPEPASPTGYAALIERFNLPVPLPSRLTAVASRTRPLVTSSWRLLTPRERPVETVAGHLAFALECEDINLDVLAGVFAATTAKEIGAIVGSAPSSAHARRLWFLYEWLTGHDLDVAELQGPLDYVPVLDAAAQVALKDGVPSPRHRVIDNLPGTRRYCPLVRWTPALRSFTAKSLDSRARAMLWNAPGEEIPRIAKWLQLQDARASFALDQVAPSSSCEARWAAAIGQAGVRSLTTGELERLRRVCGGGEARARSKSSVNGESVVPGMIDYTERALGGSVDPVVVAAAAAFGFVHLEPAKPCHGLIHRWLVHYVLGAGGYRPEAAVLPVSAVFERAEGYGRFLTDASTGSRYFDATPHAEFLFTCVEQAVEHDLRLAVRGAELDAAP